jgi:hypothetical protein
MLTGTHYDNIKSISLLAIVSLITACGGGTSGNGNATATVSFSANPYTMVAGDQTTLTWSSSNASSCTALGSWSGSKSLSGSENITLDTYGDYTFSIDCAGATASVNATVSDEDSEGSCRNPHNAKIKESYIGNYELPIPQNQFGEDHLRAIGFKDYGVEWIYQNYKKEGASWISDCSQDEYIKLMYRTTLRQLKEHGVETAWIYNFGYWQDDQAEFWQINHNYKHLDDWVIEYIAQTVQDMGMNMHYAWQFLSLDVQNDFMFPFNGQVFVDKPLLKKIMDAHEEHILWEASRLQDLGVASMSADWSAMWICFCGVDNEADQNTRNELKNYFMERMGSIITQIKGRFDGEVYVGEGVLWNDSRVFDQVDGVIGSLPNLLWGDEVANATVDLIEERLAEYINQLHDTWACNTQQPCWEYTTYQQPKMIWNLFAQSHATFLSKGWIEDGFCTSGEYEGVYYDCKQYAVPTDFSAQAIFIEGMLRAIDKQPWFETKGTTAITAYWLSDTLIPEENQYPADDNALEGFPNISQSVRGKPAEKIIKAWYTGQYDQYNPEYE